MKELDFDELDRAVNSLVGHTNSKASEQASTGKPVSQPVASTTNNEQKPDSQTSQRVVVSTSSSPKVPSGGVTPERRTGRLDSSKRPAKSAGKGFIDIVAPKPAPVTRVSHTSPTIQPVSKKDVVPEPTKPVAPVNAKPAAEEVVETVAKPVSKPKSSEEKWPDPLDFHETAAESSAQSGTSSDSKQPTDEKLPSSTDSPFLPGAKVEKRPLGAFTPAAVVEEKATEPEKPEEAKPPEPLEELQPETIAKSTPDDGIDKKLTVDEPEEESPEPPGESSKKQVHESAMMSIPQQYKTATKPVDEVPRPVFDTKEYHPPLLESTAHAAHRGGSVWGKLLVWLLVIAVLAVGGYFAFLYFVQNF